MSGSEIQVEQGNFTRIHNTILERLAITKLSGTEFRCLLYLLRQTYGYGKKEDRIGLTQWAKNTGMQRQNVWEVLNSLKEKHIIYVIDNGPKRAQTWGFNKYFEQWNTSVDDTTVMLQHDSLNESVMPEDDTSVMLQHDRSDDEKTSTVMPQHYKTVMPQHNTQKKKRNKRSVPNGTAVDTAPPPPKEPTEHQRYFGKVCEIVGWDYRTIGPEKRGQVAQTMDILKNAGYTLDDLCRFGRDVWVKDWRWKKNREYPTLDILRTEIGKLRSAAPATAPPPEPVVIPAAARALAERAARAADNLPLQ